jgi:hypothetical protein
MQVYTMMFSANGDFMIFWKREKGFFYHGKDGGAIIKSGQPIPYGANHFALPGGKMESDDITIEGRKEFMEECGAKICFGDTVLKINGQEYPICNEHTYQFSTDYSAYYVKLSNTNLKELFSILSDTNFPQSINAVGDIKQGVITTYDAIFERYPYCPADNELDYVWLWNILQNQDAINQLNKEPTDWFYNIIMYLKQNFIYFL